MRRKIIKQGAATLTVSLPAKWVKLCKLTNGDEIDIQEEGKTLIIHPFEGKPPLVRKTLNLSTSSPLANRILAEYYINGVDEVLATFTSQAQFHDLQTRALPQMLGFEVVEQSANTALIRDVSRPQSEEFNTFLRKTFLLIPTLCDTIIDLSKGVATIESIHAIDANINRSVNFCLRLLSKENMPDTPRLASTLRTLELLGDLLKDYSTRHHKITDSLFKEYTQFTRELSKLWFDFSTEKATKLARSYQTLSKKLDKHEMLRHLAEITVTLFGLRLGKE